MINPYDVEEEDVIVDGYSGEELTCIGIGEWSIDFVDNEGDFISVEYDDDFWKTAEFVEEE